MKAGWLADPSSGGPAPGTWRAMPRRSGPSLRGSTTQLPRGASTLTCAELRLLPLLATHLSFSEIAAQMFLSPDTIKSQANSIYRKLGASTRSQAVARSRDLGLLDTW